MRLFVKALFLTCFLASPVFAQGLPKALETRLIQGVQACLAFYEHRENISTLAAKGFSPVEATGYSEPEQWMQAKVIISPQNPRKRPLFVRVIVENGDECEIHSNYLKGNTERLAFDLAKVTVAQSGFTTIHNATFGSRSKSVFQKGQVSMWFLVRNRSGKLMVKFRERRVK